MLGCRGAFLRRIALIFQAGGIEVTAQADPISVAARLRLAAAAHGTLVVDMTSTQFCDTAGITGLDQVIPNVTSLEEALGQTSAPSGRP